MTMHVWAGSAATPEPLTRSTRSWPRRPDFDEGSWRSRAACAGMGPSLFFPAGERAEEALEEIQGAKAICMTCPVRLHCLLFALATNQEEGIWGGRTPSERRSLRRLRRSRRARRSRLDLMPERAAQG